MGSKSDFLENAWLAYHLEGTAIPSLPAAGSGNYWFAFFTVTPGDAGGGTETAYTNYVRQPVLRAPSAWTRSGTSPTRSANTNQINFPTVGATAGAPLTGWGLFDASSGGNMLYWGDLATPQTIVTGNGPYIPALGAQINED